eukprot:ANDGO_02365.mRNA.1 hypothetical protein
MLESSGPGKKTGAARTPPPSAGPPPPPPPPPAPPAPVSAPSYSSERSPVEESLRKENTRLSELVDNLQSQVSHLEQYKHVQLDKHTQVKQLVDLMLAEERADFERKSQRVLALLVEKDAEIDSLKKLKSEVEHFKTENSRLEISLEKERELCSMLQNEVSSRQTHIAELDRQLSKFKSDVAGYDVLVRKNAKLEADLDMTLEKIAENDAKDAYIAQLKSRVYKLEELLRSAQSVVLQKEEEEKKSGSNKKRKIKNQACQSDFGITTADFESEILRLRMQMSDIREKSSVREHDLQDRLVMLQREYDRSELELKQAREMNSVKIRTLEEAKSQLSKRTVMHADLAQMADELLAERMCSARLRAENELHLDRMKKMEHRIQSLEKRALSSSTDRPLTSAVSGAASAPEAQSASSKAADSEMIATLSLMVDERDARIEDLKRTNQELREAHEKLASAVSDHATIVESYAKLEKEYLNARERIGELEKEKTMRPTESMVLPSQNSDAADSPPKLQLCNASLTVENLEIRWSHILDHHKARIRNELELQYMTPLENALSQIEELKVQNNVMVDTIASMQRDPLSEESMLVHEDMVRICGQLLAAEAMRLQSQRSESLRKEERDRAMNDALSLKLELEAVRHEHLEVLVELDSTKTERDLLRSELRSKFEVWERHNHDTRLELQRLSREKTTIKLEKDELAHALQHFSLDSGHERSSSSSSSSSSKSKRDAFTDTRLRALAEAQVVGLIQDSQSHLSDLVALNESLVKRNTELMSHNALRNADLGRMSTQIRFLQSELNNRTLSLQKLENNIKNLAVRYESEAEKRAAESALDSARDWRRFEEQLQESVKEMCRVTKSQKELTLELASEKLASRILLDKMKSVQRERDALISELSQVRNILNLSMQQQQQQQRQFGECDPMLAKLSGQSTSLSMDAAASSSVADYSSVSMNAPAASSIPVGDSAPESDAMMEMITARIDSVSFREVQVLRSILEAEREKTKVLEQYLEQQVSDTVSKKLKDAQEEFRRKRDELEASSQRALKESNESHLADMARISERHESDRHDLQREIDELRRTLRERGVLVEEAQREIGKLSRQLHTLQSESEEKGEQIGIMDLAMQKLTQSLESFASQGGGSTVSSGGGPVTVHKESWAKQLASARIAEANALTKWKSAEREVSKLRQVLSQRDERIRELRENGHGADVPLSSRSTSTSATGSVKAHRSAASSASSASVSASLMSITAVEDVSRLESENNLLRKKLSDMRLMMGVSGTSIIGSVAAAAAELRSYAESGVQTERHSHAATSCQTVKAAVADKDAQCTVAGAEESSLKESVQKSQLRNAELEQKLSAATSVTDKLRAEFATEKKEWLDQVADLQDAVDSFAREKDSLIRNFKAEVAQLLATHETEKLEFESRISYLKKELMDRDRRASETEFSTRSQMDSAIAKLRDEVDTHRQVALEKLKNEWESYREKEDSVKARLHSRIAMLETELQANRTKLREKEAEHSAVVKKVADLDEEKAKWEAARDKKSGTMRTLQKELDAAKKALSDKDGEVALLNVTMKKLDAALSESKAAADRERAMRARGSDSTKEIQQELDAKTKEFNAKQSGYEEQIAKLKDSVKTLKAELARKLEAMDVLKHKLEKSSSVTTAVATGSSGASSSKDDEAIKKLRDDLSRRDTQMKVLKSKLENLEAELSKTQAERDEAADKARRAREDLSRKESFLNIQKVKSEHSEALQQQKENLEKQLVSTQEALKVAKATVDHAHERWKAVIRKFVSEQASRLMAASKEAKNLRRSQQQQQAEHTLYDRKSRGSTRKRSSSKRSSSVAGSAETIRKIDDSVLSILQISPAELEDLFAFSDEEEGVDDALPEPTVSSLPPVLPTEEGESAEHVVSKIGAEIEAALKTKSIDAVTTVLRQVVDERVRFERLLSAVTPL